MKIKRTLTTVAAVLLCAGMIWAQGERRGGRDENAQRGGGRGGRGGGGDARRLLEYDADGNLLVEEQELRNGLAQLQKDAATALKFVMRGVDVDADGKLGDDEAAGLIEAVQALSTVRRADRNRDWQLSDDEMSTLWEQAARACQQHNQGLLQRFDKDGDGQLNAQEAAEAKQQMPERGRGGGGGRGGQGGEQRREGGGRGGQGGEQRREGGGRGGQGGEQRREGGGRGGQGGEQGREGGSRREDRGDRGDRGAESRR